MFGLDTFVLQTVFYEYLVRVERFSSRLTPEQRRLAEHASTSLRLDVETRAPGAFETAQLLVAALNGEGPIRPRPHALSFADDGFEREVLRQLEDAFLSGRLAVERRVVAPLTHRSPVDFPDLPPLPPPRPESNLHTFELRLIDETGRAINGVTAEFSSAGELRTVSTNAAGVALFEGLQSSSGSASLPDPEALSKVLDPRWEKFRPGKPSKEGNMQEVVFRGAELGPFSLKAEVPNTVVIKPPLGKLFVELWDKTGRVRHANRTYEITGPQSFEGSTDEDGRLLQKDVFPGDCQLSLTLDFFEEGDPDRLVDILESSLLVLDPAAGEPQVRLIGAVPRSILARLHKFFNTNKTFLLPTALPSIQKLRKLDAKKRWGKVEDHLMMISMPGFVDKPKSEDQLRWFQRTRELKVDGDASKDTRRALIEEYMSLDGASLEDFVGAIDAAAHGCGEGGVRNSV